MQDFKIAFLWDWMFLGVFDGHGGTEASDFCSKSLPRILALHIQNGLEMEEALKKRYHFPSQKAWKHE